MLSEIHQKLWDAIRTLAVDERHLVVKLHIYQVKQTELANALGVSQKTISKRNRKILEKLRRMLDKE